MIRTLNPFRKLTPAEMLAKQLAEAECSRVLFAATVEQHQHHLRMLEGRIVRVRAELKALMESEGEQA